MGLDWSCCLVFTSVWSWGFRGASHCPPHCSCCYIDPQPVSLDTRWPRAASLAQTVLRAQQRELRVVLVRVSAVWALSEHLRPQTVAKINAMAGVLILSVMFLNISNSKGRTEEEKQILELHGEKTWTSEAKGYMIFCGFWGVLPSPSLTCFQPWPLAPGTCRAKEKIAESRSIIFHIRSATDQEMLGGFVASPVSNEQFHGTSSAVLWLANQHSTLRNQNNTALEWKEHAPALGGGVCVSLISFCTSVFTQLDSFTKVTLTTLTYVEPN